MRYKTLILTLALMMAGCGTKAALYLPEEEEPVAAQSAVQGSGSEGQQPAVEEEDEKP